MKKILSCLLCAAMLASCAASVVVAADDPVVDKAILLDDISIPNDQDTGALGYIVNDDAIVKDRNGVGVAFDFNLISSSSCSHMPQINSPTWRHQSALIFSFGSDSGHQAVVYDAIRKEFQIGTVPWPRAGHNPDMSHVLKRKKYDMNPGEWHRIFYSVQGTEVIVYVDGEEILRHDFCGGPNGNVARSFLMFWPTHIRCMLDNMVVGNDEFVDGVDTKENEDNIFYKADFNDATAPVYDHTVSGVPTWEVAKDANGKELSDEDGNPVFVQATDENGKPVVDKDGNPVWKQAVDEKGNLLTHDEYYYKVGNEIIKGADQKHAGFVFETFGETVPYTGVDKVTYSGMVKEAADAVISVEDTTGYEGQTFTAAINYNSKNGAVASAKNLVLAYDPIFDSAEIKNIADKVSITVHDGNLVDITVPKGFDGKLADLVLTVPDTNDMALGAAYRYGFMVGASTAFADASGAAIAADTVKLDGAMAFTKDYVIGDANRDGSINAKDIAMMMYYITKYSAEESAAKKEAKDKGEEFDSKAFEKNFKMTYKKTYPKLKNFKKSAANYFADNDQVNNRDVIELMKYIVSLPVTSK